MDKKSLSERDICSKYIAPAVQQAGWGHAQAGARGSELYQRPHHRPGKTSQAFGGKLLAKPRLALSYSPDRPHSASREFIVTGNLLA